MIHKNLTPYYWGPKVTSRKPPQMELAVCVRGVFRLAPGEPVVPIEDPIEQGFMSGDTYADDDLEQLGPLQHANDFADYKLHGEVLLKGSAHPPGGPATECTVRFAVGDWSKSLHVVGPRAYKPGLLLGGKAGEPQPFASMPLTWQNAYGGEGYADNPVGRGFQGETLPTVQLPGKPVQKVGARSVTPATFLPISPQWPQRRGKRGRNYGDKWKRTRAPWYADDFDWTYFQSAPADQQLAGYLRGDEALSFDNLHPDAPSWQTRLPGVRIRVFVKTADGIVHEPEMALDTLLADLDDGKLCLLWRGLAPITQLDMSDVVAVLIAQEQLADAPADAAVYLRQLAEFEADPVGLDASLPAGFMMVANAIEAAEQAELNGTPMPDLAAIAAQLPPECPFPPWFLAAAGGDEDPLGILAQLPGGSSDQPAMMALATPDKQAELQQQLAALQQDPANAVQLLGGIAALLPPEQQAGFQQALGGLEQALAASNQQQGSNALAAAAGNAEAAAPMSEGFATMIDAVESVEQTQGALGDAPRSLDDAAALALARLATIPVPEMPDMTGVPMTEEDFAAETAKLDAEEARLRKKLGDDPMLGMFDMGRELIANAPRPGEIMAGLGEIPSALQKVHDALSAQGISAAALAPLTALLGKVTGLLDQLPPAPPLPEGEFVKADLRGRDFSGQDLTGHCFCKSDLTGARFVDADLTGADFRKADLSGADLTGATLADATFGGATLSKAKLTGVKARGVRFTSAELGEADFSGADLEGARLTSARAAKAKFGKARLCGADLRFADLAKVDLRDADLTDADLSLATVNLAKADGANFSGARFDAAKLTKSRLQGAILRGSRCNMGDFTGSDLTGADLRDVTFERADLMKTVLDRADFSGARLHRTVLRDTKGEGTDFRHADLTGSSATGAAKFVRCDFRHANGNRSVWLDADLSGSTFRHARFEHAFFHGAKGSDIDFLAAVMKQASFRKVVFTRVSFAYADLGGAVFQEASLDDGDFRKANCYDAKFLGAKAVRCRFEDAFLVGVQLDDPDQQQPQPPA
ncbi:MAG: DUF2169 domain-containing protein [Planctomycetota bacterium]